MDERESIELPGVGELRGRPGTSTMALAGAAKFWHDKYQSARRDYQSARRDGFIAASILIAVAEVAALIVYTLITRR